MLGREALQRLALYPARLAVAATLLVCAFAAAVVALAPGEGELRYSGVPRVELPLPRPGGDPEERTAGRERTVEATSLAAVRPGAIDPDLMEAGTYGPLPRVAPDGSRSAVAYARPFDASDPRPKVAIVLTGLGLQDEITKAAMALPGPVTLQFSPYAPDLPRLIGEAHRAGHEVLLDLPMEPADYPQSDPGPHTLLAAASTEGNLDRLLWLLARATGYFGVTGGGGRFARSAQAPPILDVLAERGLALIELGSSELRPAAEEVGLPYAQAELTVDDVPSRHAIDQALAALEVRAIEGGGALAIAQPYPITLERLRIWAATLADKDLLLVPASALVIGRAGRAAELDGDGVDLPVSQL